MRALHIAATGLSAQQMNVEVIANNMANINTTGFKRARAEFTDLLYMAERLQGVSQRGEEGVVPEGAQVGLGVRTAAIRNLHIQGTIAQTGNKLDLALTGRGFYQIQGPDGETLYTRAGAFNTNGAGQIVTLDGYTVQPAMNVPQNTLEVIVSESGAVSARIAGQTDLQQLGQIALANFANEAGLEPLGGNLYRQTIASGAPTTGNPGSEGFGAIRQGYLESSNVDPVKEITELISAQRAYEMNSKVVQAADDMSSTLSRIIR
ncbi:MAG: flagellar basal-body rod protein FlgG [Methylobacteriaceae bacterium]|nr:flagellar basal-body rod protein FlgG [Methylobacteriaceae bacterium]